MLSNFDAAVEAALIRKEISSKEIADEKRSGQRGNNFELKNSNGKVVSRISMERVEQLKDPETLEKAKEAAKPKPVIPKEELEAQALAEREALIEKKKAEEAAEALKPIPSDLLKVGICERIIDEPNGGAHRDFESSAISLKNAIIEELEKLSRIKASEFLDRRIQKYHSLGYFND